MIDRETLQGQLDSLASDREGLERQYQQVIGAERLCRYLLELLDDQDKTEDGEPAEPESEDGDGTS